VRGVVVALVLHQIMAPPGLIIYATQSHMLVTNLEFQSYKYHVSHIPYHVSHVLIACHIKLQLYIMIV